MFVQSGKIMCEESWLKEVTKWTESQKQVESGEKNEKKEGRKK